MTDNALLLFQQNDFCIQELTLYLDTHPQDKTAYRLLRRHLEKREELKFNLEDEMGPLTHLDNTARENTWYKGPWPWENEVNHHVDL